MITITGTALGQPVTVTWDAGELGGDPVGVYVVRRFAESGAELTLPPVGPTFDAGLGEAWRAVQTILGALGGGQVVADAGEDLTVPGAVDVPDGAVI